MAYPEAMRERAKELYREKPEVSYRDIIKQLTDEFPGLPKYPDPRQIGRWVTPSVEAKRPQAGKRMGDVVYQQAWLRHIPKVAGATEKLQRQFDLPEPYSGASWVPPQGGKYGVRAIYTGSHHARIRYDYQWDPQGAVPGKFSLSVEDDLYFPCVKGHIPDPDLWSQFQEWKGEAPEYFGDCREFLKLIIEECERRTGSGIFIDSEWPQEGVFWYFAERVYAHYTYLAQGYRGLGELVYETRGDLSRLPEQGIVHTLWHGGGGIACHRDSSVLREWEEVHKTLLTADNPVWRAAAEALVQRHKHLKELAAPIRKVLLFEIERGTFDRGRCELCP